VPPASAVAPTAPRSTSFSVLPEITGIRQTVTS
jgi:hypothetical protein